MNPIPSNPPPVRRPLKRPIALIAGATLFGAFALFIATQMDGGATLSQDADSGNRILGDIAVPTPLTARDIREINRGRETDVQVAQAAWIETVDPDTGRLAQRYRFTRLDPNPANLPEGWFEMEHPEAHLYLRTGELITLSGNTAQARAPQQMLEDGVIRGNVVVRLFRADANGIIDPDQSEPELEITTEEARFDSVIGEITCDGAVLIQSRQAEIPGRALRLRVNDQDEQVALEIGSIDYIRLDMTPVEVADSESAAPVEDPAPKTIASAKTATPGDPPPKDDATATTPEDEAEIDVYLLTLSDNVVIRTGEREARRTAYGDRLELVFTPMSSGAVIVADTDAGTNAGTVTDARTDRRRIMLAGGTTNTVAPSGRRFPSEHVIIITCDGGLTMTPLTDEARHPVDPRDAHLTLSGAPVRLEDETAEAEATAASLVYASLTRTVELNGSDSFPLAIRTPRFEVDGERFWLNQSEARGGLSGPGQLTAEAKQSAEAVAGLASTSFIGGDNSSNEQNDATSNRMQIAWGRKLDLLFQDEGDDLQLERAQFIGDVTLSARQMAMTADTFNVGFAASDDGQREPIVESIAADAVRLQRVGESGQLAADQLDLQLDREAGNSVLRGMQASGNVEADNQGQTLWADRLDATFRQVVAAEANDEQAATDPAARTEVHTVHAQGNLQILLSEGARVFADELRADAGAGTAHVMGEHLMIGADELLIDQGTRIDIDQQRQVARWQGPGRARVLGTPMPTRFLGRINRPIIDDSLQPEVDATWTEAMDYEYGTDNEGGIVNLFGDVSAVVQRSPTDRSTLSGEQLTLTFLPDDANPLPDADAGPGGQQRLKNIIARGDARLEGRSWETEERLSRPQVFYIAGDHVAFDHQRTEASVLGAGTLLIRDITVDENEKASNAPFSGKGITMFEFTDNLEMQHIAGEEYRIVMRGDVKASHKALDGRTATMTGQSFDARVLRMVDPTDGAPAAQPGLPGEGVRMRLLHLHGEGDIYIRTPRRRVECDRIDYDVSEGIAHLQGSSGRVVTVFATDATPVNAKSIVWNLNNDTIRLDQASGTGVR